MSEPLPQNELLDEWHRWAEWVLDPNRDESKGAKLVGWSEFDWAVYNDPELAWRAILEALRQPRMAPYLPTLAAGPLEDLLSLHGERFIDRVESEAESNPKFAWLLDGVWQHDIPDSIWARVKRH